MREGWCGEDYLVLFDDLETAEMTQRYDLDTYLAGYQIIGLRGWDDFILRNPQGELFTIPTVPIDPKYLTVFPLLIANRELAIDDRLRGKIKWYTKPIVFGGHPTSLENICWITIDQHVQVVKWFNQLYRTMATK